MNVRKSVLSLSLVLIFVLSACSGAVATTPIMQENSPAATEVMADTGKSDAMMNETATPDAMMAGTATSEAMMGAMTTPDTMMAETATPDAMMSDNHDGSMVNDATPDTMMAETATSEAMMGTMTTPDAMMAETATPDAMMSDATPGAMMESPAYFDATLTDAASMQPFTIHDFQGKVVLVETMAMWCPNCLQQQKQVKALHTLLGERDDFVSVSLDIDPNEEAGPLKSYVEKNGFDWTYAIAPAAVSKEIGQLYGQQFLNPTSTPMFIIDSHGQVHTLSFGIKSAESLKNALDPFLNAGM